MTHNCWSNYVLFFICMINSLVWTYPEFCKFSENNLPTLQGLKQLSALERINNHETYSTHHAYWNKNLDK